MTEGKIHKCHVEGEKFENDQMRRLAKETADEIRKVVKLDKTSTIFDFGAGPGLIGLNFVNEVKHVIFEDVSSVMLEYLQHKCKEQNITNITIFHGIMEYYKGEEKVDLITAGQVLHHIEDLESLFKCFLSILKPNGYLVITDLKKDATMFNLEPLKNHHKMPHKGFVPEELCKKLETFGFIKTEIKPVYNYQNKYI